MSHKIQWASAGLINVPSYTHWYILRCQPGLWPGPPWGIHCRIHVSFPHELLFTHPWGMGEVCPRHKYRDIPQVLHHRVSSKPHMLLQIYLIMSSIRKWAIWYSTNTFYWNQIHPIKVEENWLVYLLLVIFILKCDQYTHSIQSWHGICSVMWKSCFSIERRIYGCEACFSTIQSGLQQWNRTHHEDLDF